MVEQIDIGGPTMLRSAAKNHRFVTVLVEPSQYDELLGELANNSGATSHDFRRKAARRVFERTASYDSAIAGYFQGSAPKSPEHLTIALHEKWSMRYGENPHQLAGFYLPAKAGGETVLERVLQGKELSYNNLLDVHAALDLISDLPFERCAAILKHTNPCGVGTSSTSLREAYERALACDPVSAFGGIVVFSGPVGASEAEAVNKTFTEIVIAPRFEPAAREIFAKRRTSVYWKSISPGRGLRWEASTSDARPTAIWFSSVIVPKTRRWTRRSRRNERPPKRNFARSRWDGRS